jgi:dihydroorotase
VVPRFVDIHCHLRPRLRHKETIETGTRAAARGSPLSAACPTRSRPSIAGPGGSTCRERQYAVGLVRVLPIGCVSRGRRGRP